MRTLKCLLVAGGEKQGLDEPKVFAPCSHTKLWLSVTSTVSAFDIGSGVRFKIISTVQCFITFCITFKFYFKLYPHSPYQPVQEDHLFQRGREREIEHLNCCVC